MRVEPLRRELVKRRIGVGDRRNVGDGRLPLAALDLGEDVAQLVLGAGWRPAVLAAAERHVLPLAVGSEAQRIGRAGRGPLLDHLAGRLAGHLSSPPLGEDGGGSGCAG